MDEHYNKDQYWIIANLDKRQRLDTFGTLKLWDILVNNLAEDLVELLQIPHVRPVSFSNFHIEGAKMKWYVPINPKGRSFYLSITSSDNKLISLPETLINALSKLLDDESQISLALTHGYFFRLLAPTVREIIIKREAPWAYDRLAVVGDYAKSFSLGESHILITPTRFKQVPVSYSQINQEEVKLLYRLLCYSEKLKVRESTEAVLRNHTKKEYVRDSALAKSEYAYSLGEVICVKTLFTDNCSGAEGLKLKGDWVTDRFDIATIKDIDREWNDVSQDAIELLAKATKRKRESSLRAGICNRKRRISEVFMGDDLAMLVTVKIPLATTLWQRLARHMDEHAIVFLPYVIEALAGKNRNASEIAHNWAVEVLKFIQGKPNPITRTYLYLTKDRLLAFYTDRNLGERAWYSLESSIKKIKDDC